MPFIGQQPLTGAYSKLDAITASATATYNLLLNGGAYSPASANHLLVSLNGVMQAPQDSFTVSGSTIIFDSALTSSDNIDFIMALGDVLNIGTPSDGTVTTAKITNDAVTNAKIGSNAVTDAKIATGITATKLSGDINYSNLPVGSVVQTVHTNQAAVTITTGSQTMQTATITPKFASSRILMITNAGYHMDNAGGAYYRVQLYYSIAGGAQNQNATLGNNYIGDAIGYPNSVYTTGARMHYGGQKLFPSYNTTSAITFTKKIILQSGTGQVSAGYNHNNDMTLMEIKQ